MLGYGETFDFKGHTYTAWESARIQTNCPHCGEGKERLGCIHPVKDKEKFEFLGFTKTSCGEDAICYLCKACGEKFWFHISERMKKNWKEEINLGLEG